MALLDQFLTAALQSEDIDENTDEEGEGEEEDEKPSLADPAYRAVVTCTVLWVSYVQLLPLMQL